MDKRIDWTQARGFLATAEQGSLSAGARALGLTQPTLGRQVAALEAALGVVLFERVGRSLVLTPAGQDMLTHVRKMGAAADALAMAAAGRADSIEGRVSITASDAMSAYWLPAVLVELRKAAPGIIIDVIASNTVRDLQRREADIAIRHVAPKEPELIARKLPDMPAYLYASRDYLYKTGTPHTLADFQQLDFIAFDADPAGIALLNQHGLPVTAAMIRATSANGVAVWEMVRQGLGVSVMVETIALHTPEVVRIMPQIAPVMVPTWLTVHREVHTNRRIRLVYDLLAEALERA
ncbi:LysR family transcriptional regulator [Pseudosulfitobacter koreensis]|uniref:LysR family transcriptional regulator n=1 Tax=Pseudosulfitobacter koreensis TaxID=2968472 RepID=A0ABT1Z165_9RHOB|nr:LysR family transcriptional regulator [Pseudosulfitobacter koreense]MCR8826895.1 LysR family transcriptional regulator [Pseudosulfitobacter koreense]